MEIYLTPNILFNKSYYRFIRINVLWDEREGGREQAAQNPIWSIKLKIIR